MGFVCGLCEFWSCVGLRCVEFALGCVGFKARWYVVCLQCELAEFAERNYDLRGF